MPELALRIDERRLLKEIPFLFQSFEEALTELVQNAYRAGAKTIELAVDHDARTLQVADDGPGAQNPEAFLTAGATGWTDTLVEPAGLGLFALLGLASDVAIESSSMDGSHWRVRLAPSCFDGAPVAFEELPQAGWAGLRIAAQLKPEARMDAKFRIAGYEYDQRTFRHHYPLTVLLTETRMGKTTREEIPPDPLSDTYVDTPVGRLYRQHLGGRDLRLISEHRVLSAHNAWHAFNQAIDRCRR